MTRPGAIAKADSKLREEVDDFNRVDHFPRLTPALIERGFSPEETTKVLGGNFMRVFDRVWKG